MLYCFYLYHSYDNLNIYIELLNKPVIVNYNNINFTSYKNVNINNINNIININNFSIIEQLPNSFNIPEFYLFNNSKYSIGLCNDIVSKNKINIKSVLIKQHVPNFSSDFFIFEGDRKNPKSVLYPNKNYICEI